MISHIVGGAIGVAALVLCVVRSAINHNGYGIAGSIVYGVSMILLYTMSSIYHGLHEGMAKKVMQVLDHCTVYLLIAGTYTPILLSAMRRIDAGASWMLMGIVWGLAVLAITLTAIDLKKFRVFSMICYIGMGWTIIFRVDLLIAAVGWAGFWLILLGGVVAYGVLVLVVNQLIAAGTLPEDGMALNGVRLLTAAGVLLGAGIKWMGDRRRVAAVLGR